MRRVRDLSQREAKAEEEEAPSAPLLDDLALDGYPAKRSGGHWEQRALRLGVHGHARAHGGVVQ